MYLTSIPNCIVNPVVIQPDELLLEQIRQFESTGLFKDVAMISATIKEGGSPESTTLVLLGEHHGEEVVASLLKQGQTLHVLSLFAESDEPKTNVFGRLDIEEDGVVTSSRYFIAREYLEDKDKRADFFTPIGLVSGLRSGTITKESIEAAKNKPAMPMLQ